MEKYTADRIVTINVDVQNDFCPGGALPVTDGDRVVPPLNRINHFTRAVGGNVVFTGDQHPAHTRHFDKWPVHCVKGTGGAALRRDLIVRPRDIIVDKGMGQEDGYSAFEGRARDGRTLERIVTPVDDERVAILLGGLATDYCVLNTGLDAMKINPRKGELRVFLLNQAIRGVNIEPSDSAKAIRKMSRAGITVVNNINDILNGRIVAPAE